MKKKQRTPLVVGGVIITTSALCAIMSGCGHDKADTENVASIEETICYTTTLKEATTTTQKSTTTTSQTTTTTQTENTTTTTAVTTTMMAQQLEMMTTTIEEVVEIELTTVSNEQSEEEIEIPESTTDTYASNLPITEYERILLCNLVGREYGSDYVPIEEKAKVVAVVINRVNSPQFPNSIYDVVTQPYQFSGYLATDTYSYQVTDSVIESVDYYFAHQHEFCDWLYFEGDGIRNYFY